MSGLGILVVDDEPLARRRLVRLITRLDWVDAVEEAGNVADARRILARMQPDILLLDIQMPGGSGFDLLDSLGPTPPATVFVTAFDEHALKAFEANAVDYVTKPIEPGRFGLALERARLAASSRLQADRIAELQETIEALKQVLRHKQRAGARAGADFWVRSRGEHLRIAAETVLRIQGERDYVRLHTEGADYLYQESLHSLESRLDADDFLRIHRSTIVRKSAVTRIRQGAFGALMVVLSDGSELRVGRTYAATVRARLM
ncbi:LytR/AlgR family response regulator transcription factor [Oryzibacter oryziterrae]|uniref:LytR/AlgR family response regulator transcription factor n=1 Tax=Oryzibacter oryziterrae TaxID=2766474 RepID=UPI001F2A75EE|nr:LytTR family DNA-binding domain-containing protein [Oryzibacter oryziterrae]